jgi:uncharacterized protein (TIGR02466 family)
MKTFELFPTPVGVYDLQRKITNKEKKCIDSLLEITIPNAGNKTSKNTHVLKEKELIDLEQFCSKSVNEFLKEVLKYKNLELRITQSWLNKSTKGGFHHLHRHANSILSGVLYIETGKEDKINFQKTLEGSSFVFEYEDWNMYNSENWWLPVKTAELFVFPSHLLHSVPLIESDKRISLSFNTFPVGSFGSVELLSNVDME